MSTILKSGRQLAAWALLACRLLIGGTVAIDNAAFGDLGETNFSAIR
jgi:hypothetical protein